MAGGQTKDSSKLWVNEERREFGRGVGFKRETLKEVGWVESSRARR